ncbi:MAG: hypothetical protein GY703_02020 [Gammaproteobacteria bacterium]|nr:hypothetical protein [Gammaproteobacteria bacterium]
MQVDEDMTWSNGSLGCPKTGMMYMHMQVKGVFIQLKAGEILYNHHGNGITAPFLCESDNGHRPAAASGK